MSNNRNSYMLSPDERSILDMYVSLYNQNNQQLTTMQETQQSILHNINHILNIQNANSTEVDPNTANKIVGLITEWQKNDGSVEIRNKNSQIGGTMRLGEYKSRILPNTLAYQIYNSLEISERHRHRYEINHNYINMIEEAGGLFSAFSST